MARMLVVVFHATGRSDDDRAAVQSQERTEAPLEGQRGDTQMGPQLGGGPGCRGVAEPLGIRPSENMQPLHAPRLPRLMPQRGDLQEAGGRYRPRRPGKVQGISLLCEGMSVQKDLL